MTGHVLTKAAAASMLLVFAGGLFDAAWARPEYLVKFQADPYRRAEVDGCGTCHVNPKGGGARNDFGTAFQAASNDITPLLRSTFPEHFKFESVKLPDGTVFYFSDPLGKFAVVERGGQRVLLNLLELSAPKAAALPPPANRMTFFVTSKGFTAPSALGGLAGADRHCQSLAKAAGAGDREWRAYLSTSYKGTAAVNAGDRIGGGPWFNAKGVRVASGPIDLHLNHRIVRDLAFTETGEPLDTLRPEGGRVTVLTGSNADGTAAVDKNCGNWATPSGEAVFGDPLESWNAAGTISCSAAAEPPLPELRLYCFAAK
jgi:hypothetical protein